MYLGKISVYYETQWIKNDQKKTTNQWSSLGQSVKNGILFTNDTTIW